MHENPGDPRWITVIRRWFSPTRPALPLTYTFLLRKTGDIFSGPNGANWFNILKNFDSIWLKRNSASICICCTNCSGLIVALTTSSKRFEKTYLWPPNWISRSLHPHNASYKSYPKTDRAEPAIYPLDRVSTIVGR